MRYLLIFVLIINAGCSSMITKGSLPEVPAFPPSASKKSLSFRYHNRRPSLDTGKGAHFFTDEEFLKLLEANLVNSGKFKEVIKHSSITGINLSGENTSPDEAFLLKVEFPVTTDLFIDIEKHEENLGPHGYMYWIFIHALSLGFVPITMPHNIHINMKVYDRTGKLLYVGKVEEQARIWAWTPLFFFNGFKLVKTHSELTQPIDDNSLRNLINQIK